MEKMEIEQLLDKFYNGLSTPEEERFLNEYFLRENEVEERLRTDRQLFRALHDERIQVPDAVSERLSDAIQQLVAPPPRSPSQKQRWLYGIGSAAAVALLCAGLFFVQREPAQPPLADTFSDPHEAAIVAGQALALMSSHLNRGLEQVAGAESEMAHAGRIINKYLTE
jgi:hypothetical protein